MQRCWKFAPIDRPTFTTLQKCFSDYKYVPSNYIFFRLEDAQDQSDCTVDAEDIYFCQPPPEVAKLFSQLQSANLWGEDAQSQDRWSNDELFINTMRTIDTELLSEQSSHDSCDEETMQDTRNGHKARRYQKRSLVFPTTIIPNAKTTFTDEQPQQQQQLQEKVSDKTDGPGKEKYTPSSNSASKLFKSDPLNMYLEPAYKELLIPSESESSLDTINANNLPHKHKQGGYRYAYP